ncbi:MAG: response regulator [Alphaproteobacteria bacterium]|nr:response regulator [Alphaproteobacteria bacterium]
MTTTYRPRVLVVDDDSSIRALISIILESLNCDVVGEGKNGAEAVALFSEMKPDLVLLDVQMPGMNGVMALKKMLSMDSSASIVMLTIVDDVNVADDCILAGAKDYIRKDRSPDALKARIARATSVLGA